MFQVFCTSKLLGSIHVFLSNLHPVSDDGMDNSIYERCFQLLIGTFTFIYNVAGDGKQPDVQRAVSTTHCITSSYDICVCW